ncbi:MAG: Unknown protein [uncultured Thiotrichaceae bacterium]|uniref:Aminoglycoside phosphotransferase domain-containing protein n=1 Tax=uncultured Thiotrichaceae bacterium TaxID=298394 RepID=A0A6S6U6P3_9GAMM|nr:MAG: Unknown protein [uncultured Thiotrichaceae bacterium]
MSKTTHNCCSLKEVATLYDAMKKHDFYSHKVSNIRVISTRSSHIFLTGSYAYKIKRNLNHPQCNYQTLEKRKAYCVKECIINRRHSSGLYVDVLPIAFKDGQYSLLERGSTFNPQDVVEYAVKMRQFNQALIFDELIRKGRLLPEKVDELALEVAKLHQHHSSSIIAPVRLKKSDLQEVIQPLTEIFDAIKHAHQLSGFSLPAQLTYLENWVSNEWQQLRGTFLQRKKEGFVRHCHGNLHLRKAVLIKRKAVIFDAVEHDEKQRFIDVASDIACAMMDFERHHQEQLSQRFLNTYLIETGDYGLLKVLSFYKVYRALQRVKVASIKHSSSMHEEQRNQHLCDIETYTDLADAYTGEHRQGSLILSHGSLREGNDCIQQIANSLRMVHVRGDAETIRLQCDNNTHQAPGALGASQITHQLQKRLFDMAQIALAAGYYVIVDVQSLNTKVRDKFVEMAIAHRAPFLILNFQNDQMKLRALVREAISAESNVVHIKSSELFKDVVESDILVNNYPILNITDESALPLGKIEQWLDNH